MQKKRQKTGQTPCLMLIYANVLSNRLNTCVDQVADYQRVYGKGKVAIGQIFT